LGVGCHVLTVNRRLDAKTHRNESLGTPQKIIDYTEIYGRHPAPALDSLRAQIIEGLKQKPN
jgi:hypothetical protein